MTSLQKTNGRLKVTKADGWLWRAISQLVPLGTGDEMELSLQEGSSCRSLLGEIMQDKLIVTFQVMFYIDEGFNNSRK